MNNKGDQPLSKELNSDFKLKIEDNPLVFDDINEYKSLKKEESLSSSTDEYNQRAEQFKLSMNNNAPAEIGDFKQLSTESVDYSDQNEQQKKKEIQSAVDEHLQEGRKKWSRAIFGLLSLLLLLFFIGGMIYFYDKNFKKVLLEEIFPGNYPVSGRINLDFDLKMTDLVSKNSKKIKPIYDFLGKYKFIEAESLTEEKKEEVKKQKNFFNYLDRYGITFEDFRLGEIFNETMYFSVPSLDPLKKEIQKVVLYTKEKNLLASYDDNQIKEFEKLLVILSGSPVDYVNYKIAESNESEKDKKYFSQERVAGASKDLVKVLAAKSSDINHTDEGLNNISKDFLNLKNPLDYIVGVQIKDLKKARAYFKKAFESLEENNFKKKKYQGFDYYELKLKKEFQEETLTGSLGLNINFIESDQIFVSIIDDNLLISSFELGIKEALDKRKSLSFLPSKKSSLSMNLKNNKKIKELFSQVTLKEGFSEIITFLVDINLDEFMKISEGLTEEELGLRKDDYFVYPKDYLAAFTLGVNEDGFIVSTAGNQGFLPDVKNVSIEQGLASRAPSQVDGLEANLFYEVNSLKDIYYSFKENHLSDKGRQSMDDEMNDGFSQTGINLEREFFDQLSAGMSLAFYSKLFKDSQVVMTSKINNKGMFLGTMNKIIELIKLKYMKSNKFYLETYESECLGYESRGVEELKMSQENGEFFAESCKQSRPFYLEAKKSYELARNLKLRERKLESGNLYSFALEDTFFDFGVTKDDYLIFGNRLEGVLGTMDYFSGRESLEVLADTDKFNDFVVHSTGEAYMDTMIKPVMGVHLFYNIANLTGIDSFLSDDHFNLFEVVLKPIDLIGYSSKLMNDGLKREIYYLKLVELSEEDQEFFDQMINLVTYDSNAYDYEDLTTDVYRGY